MAFQIIHTFEKFINRFQIDGNPDFKSKVGKCLVRLKDFGIDGIVINIDTENGYLENAENWKNFEVGLNEAVKQGFRIWLYDEKGYPSGSAGGIVLRDNPELEAKGIKMHKGRYFISNIYEGSHAERNFHEKRRYINLLESAAVGKFAKSTYYKYSDMLPEDLFSKVEAIFTDEPSLMTVVTRDLDGNDGDEASEMSIVAYGRRIPVHDEPDPNVPVTPSIPYSRELDALYEKRYGGTVLEAAPEIFSQTEEISQTKCRFWEAVAETYEGTFGKTLSEACDDIGTKLTGHILFEETPILNTAFHANPFRILKYFHIPGIDQLSNIQENISVFAHKIAQSCAWLKGIDGVMTETSDFMEYRFGPKKPTGYKKITAALYRQYALGVREFSFYYDFNIRKDKYSEIAGTIKKLYAFGRGFRLRPDCAVYCAYETVWAGFRPSMAVPFDIFNEQPPFVRDFEKDILGLCDDFYARNIQFVMMDESSIEDMVGKGIRQVILPNCRVVSGRLIKLYEEGRIELIGKEPEYMYLDGKLEKVTGVQTKGMESLSATAPYFTYEEGLIYSAFENEAYFCFNPTNELKRITVATDCGSYDPKDDKTDGHKAGDIIVVEPDSAVMIAKGEDK